MKHIIVEVDIIVDLFALRFLRNKLQITNNYVKLVSVK